METATEKSLVDKLIVDFKTVDDMILNTRFNKSFDTIRLKHKLRGIHQRALRLHMSYLDDVFYVDNYHSKHDKDAMSQLEKLLVLINTAREFLDSELKMDQFKTMRRLTFVSTLCLPLSIITGFFGMNFRFMGIDQGSSGMLRSRTAPYLLFSVLAASVISIVLLFKFNVL